VFSRVGIYVLYLQVNATVTALIGGRLDYRRVITFDWQTMEYTLHDMQFQVSQLSAACANLRGQNGENLVAVGGGQYAPGMNTIKLSAFCFRLHVMGPSAGNDTNWSFLFSHENSLS